MFDVNWVFGIVIKSTLLLAVAWLLGLIWRKGAPALLHRIWALSFCGCLLVPLMCLSPLVWSLYVPALPTTDATMVRSDLTASTRTDRDPYHFAAEPAPALRAEAKLNTPGKSNVPQQREVTPARTRIWVVLRNNLNGIGIAIWLAGVVYCFSRLVRGHLVVRQLLASTTPADDTWNTLSEACRRKLNVAAKIRLRVSPKTETPVAFGLLQPTVLLPADSASWPVEQRRLVLLHEFAHIKRHDVLTQSIANVVAAVHWFNPLGWFGVSQMRQLREIACDDLVLQNDHRPADYATLLFEAAKGYSGHSIGTAMGMVHREGVEGRILAVLDNARSRVGLNRKRTVVLFLTALCVTGFIGTARLALRVAAQEPTETTSEQTSELRNMEIRVLDESGSPLEGARIHSSVWYTPDFKGEKKRRRDLYTDKNGKLMLEIPRRLRILRLWAYKDRYVPEFINFAQGTHDEGLGIANEFEFRLAAGTEIGGVVVDERDEPIAGVQVDVKVEVDKPSWSSPKTMISTWLTDKDYTSTKAITDEQGRWRIRNAPSKPGKSDFDFRLKLSHPSYTSDANFYGGLQEKQNVTTPMLRSMHARIVMEDGVKVTGQIAGAGGMPVTAGLVVWADDPYHGPGVSETEIESDGSFTTLPLSPGEYPFTIVAPGHRPVRKVLQVTKDMDPLQFQLKTGKRLEIRIVDRSGAPIPNAYVSLRGWQDSEALYNHKHPNVPLSGVPRQADENGSYVWDWAPADAVKYGISSGNHSYSEVTLIAKDESHVVQLNSKSVASGTVTDDVTGKPIGDFTAVPVIEFRPDFLSTNFHDAKPGKAGVYELPLDHPEPDYRHRVRIEAPGYTSAVSKESFSQADGRVRIDFKLKPAKARTGMVVDADGQPVFDAEVVDASPSIVPMMQGAALSWDGRSQKTLKNGQFELLATSEPVRIRALHASGFAEVHREPDEPIGTLRLKPWASIEGRLVQDGQPVAAQFISFVPLINRQLGEARFQDSFNATTDEDGRFRFDRVPPIAGYVRAHLGPWQDSPLSASKSVPFELKPGETRHIELGGGKGVVLSGSVDVVGREDRDLNKKWSLNYLVSRDRGVPVPQEVAARLGFDPKSPLKPSRFLDRNSSSQWLATRENYFVKLSSDGELRVPGVPVGTYDLVLKLYEEPVGCLVETVGEKVVTIEVTEQDVASGTKNIGKIGVTCRSGPKIGENMELHKFVDMTGRHRTVRDLKGRFTVIHVWASWCRPCVELMPEMVNYADSLRDKPVTFVGYNIDADIEFAKRLAEVHNLAWSQNYLGEDSKTARQLAVHSVPTYYLVGPDGNLVGAENEWSNVTTKLDSLLEDR